jgi:hypothetical protein
VHTDRIRRVERAHQLHGGANRRLLGVLARERVAERDERAIADEAVDVTALLHHHPGDDVAEDTKHHAEVFEIESVRQSRRLDEIAEQDGRVTQFDTAVAALRNRFGERLAALVAEPRVDAVRGAAGRTNCVHGPPIL